MDTVVLLAKEGEEESEKIRLEFTKARLRGTAGLFRPLVIQREAHRWVTDRAPGKRGRKPDEQKRQWFVDAYDLLSEGVTATPGFTGKPVRKVATDRIRDMMVERGWLTKEYGKLPASERAAFKRAKEHFIGARTLVEDKGLIWRI